MVIKLYISGISGNKEVKKKQQRVQMILDSKQISYEAIDITEPGKEKDKEFMQQNGKVRESLGKYPLPPQIFNDDDFCGDYEDFDLANEVDELEKFLHLETSPKDNGTDAKVNGLTEQIVNSNELPEDKEQIEEVTKSEVNGESKAETNLEPSSENKIENVEPSEEVISPEKEESSLEDNKKNDESRENDDNETTNDAAEDKVEEDTENEEKEENVENVKEENTENPSEKESPSNEEKEESDDNKDEEEVKSEKEENEENESEEESPHSEKSQEE